MLTWSDLQGRFQDFSNDDSAANLTLGKSLMNYAHNQLVNAGNFIFGEIEFNITSAISTFEYAVSPRAGKMISAVWIQTANTDETPLIEVKNLKQWNQLKSGGGNSGRPTHFFVMPGLREFWVYPTPDEAKTITVTARRITPQFNVDDYVTGTATFTNGDETVTGSGTTYTAAMVGRHILGGDGYFYQIGTFTSTTSLELTVPYGGSTEASVATKIGQCPIIPEQWQDGIWQYGIGMYEGQQKDGGNSGFWLGLYERTKNDIRDDQLNRTTEQVMRDSDLDEERSINDNPNGPL